MASIIFNCAAAWASSANAFAASILSLLSAKASSALFLDSIAFASSRSFPLIAVSASTVTISG